MLERFKGLIHRQSRMDRQLYKMLDLIRLSQEEEDAGQEAMIRLQAKSLAGKIMRGLSNNEKARAMGFKLKLLKIENPQTVDTALRMFEEVVHEKAGEILGSQEYDVFE